MITKEDMDNVKKGNHWKAYRTVNTIYSSSYLLRVLRRVGAAFVRDDRLLPDSPSSSVICKTNSLHQHFDTRGFETCIMNMYTNTKEKKSLFIHSYKGSFKEKNKSLINICQSLSFAQSFTPTSDGWVIWKVWSWSIPPPSPLTHKHSLFYIWISADVTADLYFCASFQLSITLNSILTLILNEQSNRYFVRSWNRATSDTVPSHRFHFVFTNINKLRTKS